MEGACEVSTVEQINRGKAKKKPCGDPKVAAAVAYQARGHVGVGGGSVPRPFDLSPVLDVFQRMGRCSHASIVSSY